MRSLTNGAKGTAPETPAQGSPRVTRLEGFEPAPYPNRVGGRRVRRIATLAELDIPRITTSVEIDAEVGSD
jgi:hypothetical protein